MEQTKLASPTLRRSTTWIKENEDSLPGRVSPSPLAIVGTAEGLLIDPVDVGGKGGELRKMVLGKRRKKVGLARLRGQPLVLEQ